MELKERKRLNNKLPGFEGGFAGLLRTEGVGLDYTTSGKLYPNTFGMGPAPLEGFIPRSIRLNSDDLPKLTINSVDKNDHDQKKLNPSFAMFSPWAALAEYALTGVSNGLNAARKSSDEFLSDAGTSQATTAGGFGYQRLNTLNTGDLSRLYKQQTAMSFLSNPIEGITRIFGKHNYDKQMRKANEIAQATNTYNRSGAISDYLSSNYYNKYGNPQSGTIFAAKGKDAVETSLGLINIEPNARTEDGEIIFNSKMQTARSIPGNKKGDKNLSMLKPSDVVLTNMYGLSDKVRQQAMSLEYANKHLNNKLRGQLGKLTDEFVKKTTVPILEQAANELKLYRSLGLLDKNNKINAKHGKDKLPGFALGSNWWIDGLGVATGLGQLISSAFLKIKKPDTYRTNPYASAALNGLASLNINPYPMYRLMRDQERRNLYAINMAGGLSGALKAYANIATGIGTQRNIADLGANIQAQNNQYKTNYYSTLLNAGQNDRQARMAANQYDLDYFSKAHAAKQQMMLMGVYNMLNALLTGYANMFKRKTFDKTYDLYAQDADLRRKELDWKIRRG